VTQVGWIDLSVRSAAHGSPAYIFPGMAPMVLLAIQAAKFMLHTRLLGQFEAVNREEIG
jgi:hypothetical protein